MGVIISHLLRVEDNHHKHGISHHWNLVLQTLLILRHRPDILLTLRKGLNLRERLWNEDKVGIIHLDRNLVLGNYYCTLCAN